MLRFVLYFMFQQTALLKAASNIVNKSGDVGWGSRGMDIQGKEQEPAC